MQIDVEMTYNFHILLISAMNVFVSYSVYSDVEPVYVVFMG